MFIIHLLISQIAWPSAFSRIGAQKDNLCIPQLFVECLLCATLIMALGYTVVRETERQNEYVTITDSQKSAECSICNMCTFGHNSDEQSSIWLDINSEPWCS